MKRVMLISILAVAAIALIGILMGAIVSGDAGDAYSSADATYSSAVQMTPVAPLIYPSQKMLVCNIKDNRTEEVVFQSSSDWYFTLEKNYLMGACP